MSDSAPSPPTFDPQQLKAALKAFNKRLKLTQLDNQSRIGVGPMRRPAVGHRGHHAARAIPQAVWDELVRRANSGVPAADCMNCPRVDSIPTHFV